MTHDLHPAHPHLPALWGVVDPTHAPAAREMPPLHIPLLEQATKGDEMTAREAWLAVALMVVALLVAMTIAGAVAEFVAPAIQEEITWAQK